MENLTNFNYKVDRKLQEAEGDFRQLLNRMKRHHEAELRSVKNACAIEIKRMQEECDDLIRRMKNVSSECDKKANAFKSIFRRCEEICKKMKRLVTNTNL